MKTAYQSTSRRAFLQLCVLVGVGLLAACSSAEPTQPTSQPISQPVPPAQSATKQDAAPSASTAASTQTPDPDETPEPTSDGKPTPPDAAGVVLLEIGTATGAADFHFNKETLEAPAGSKIKLKFTNNTDPQDEIGHNWVLVKPGQEDSVLANGIKAGDDKDWLDVKDPGIIARTRLLEGNQTHTITFEAPPAGTYTYLCTFPEHHAGGMSGKLTIK